MKPARIDLFAKLNEDEKMNLTYQDFTVSEIEEIIAETPLKDICKQIARLRYIECCTIEEIADKLYIDYKTCQRKIQRISQALKKTCVRMFV